MAQQKTIRHAHHLASSVMLESAGIPLNVKRVASHESQSTQHSHDFQELVVILAGHGKHETGSEMYETAAGDVFVILGDTTHGYPEAENLSLINVLFDPEQLRIPLSDIGNLPGYHALFTIEPQLRAISRHRNYLRIAMDELGYVSEIISEIEEELSSRHAGFQFMAVSHLMRLIGYLSRRFDDQQREINRPVARISRLLSHINQNYSDTLTVEDLMAVAHMSQSSLMRTFHQITGRSPIDYLIRLRISKAENRLRTTGNTISEIAQGVGFADSNYFTRQFRRIYGISPRDYRSRLAV